MAAVPTGTLFSVATTFGSTITVTAVTNANPAVCTATAHGLSNGDIIEFTSGWGRANKRVFRVANVATNTFELEGFDTSSTSFFPAGTGIGTVREVTAWTQLTKVMNPATQGGDPKTVTYKFVESDVEYSINDGFTATSYTLEFDDDDTTAGYTAMLCVMALQGHGLKPDSGDVLVTGANGGVGSVAVQVAKAHGARVADAGGEIGDPQPQDRVYDLAGDLAERLEDECTLVEAWMGQREPGLVETQVAHEQEVEVEDAGGVALRAAHPACLRRRLKLQARLAQSTCRPRRPSGAAGDRAWIPRRHALRHTRRRGWPRRGRRRGVPAHLDGRQGRRLGRHPAAGQGGRNQRSLV